jgi:hypothetical protein
MSDFGCYANGGGRQLPCKAVTKLPEISAECLAWVRTAGFRCDTDESDRRTNSIGGILMRGGTSVTSRVAEATGFFYAAVAVCRASPALSMLRAACASAGAV